MIRGERLTAAEAAARLGVKPATLYAYVSRGLLGRERSAGGRTSTFDPAEVERLTRRGRSGRRGRRPAGELVVESALTAIAGGALWYRGLPVTELADAHTFEEVAALPGVGRYTAGAVLCFAFGKRAPILDTNVQRVLERLFVRRPATSPSAMQKRLWRLAEEVLPQGAEAWVINQAMMDLGATLCTARNPRCTQCCLQALCQAAPTFTTQLGLFPYPDALETDLPMVAEADAPVYGGGTPPPDFTKRDA